MSEQEVETCRSLQPSDLLHFNIVYFSDAHKPGDADWCRTLGA